MLAQQNIETLNEAAPQDDRGVLPALLQHHLAEEYPQLGGNYEVIHHTQLLARLVAEGKLTPAGRVEEKLTYHDPCFLGRHNKVFTPPREIIDAVPGDHRQGDAPVQEPRVLLRRGRGADVDGRADRQADQHRADRGGPGAEPGHDLHRLPVLPGHARRRGQREEELRRRPGHPRSR